MHDSWKDFLDSEFAKPYFKELSQFLHEAYETKTVFPAKPQVFRAFTTDLNQVKVVILGQDPYHTPGAAHGLAFSVPNSQPIPPSLINIYKEIDDEYGSHANPRGNLSSWQQQGVLLLNNVLTVEAHRAGSHLDGAAQDFVLTDIIAPTTLRLIPYTSGIGRGESVTLELGQDLPMYPDSNLPSQEPILPQKPILPSTPSPMPTPESTQAPIPKAPNAGVAKASFTSASR